MDTLPFRSAITPLKFEVVLLLIYLRTQSHWETLKLLWMDLPVIVGLLVLINLAVRSDIVDADLDALSVILVSEAIVCGFGRNVVSLIMSMRNMLTSRYF